MAQKVEIDGAEVEVYTAAERQADIDAAVTAATAAKDAEFGKTREGIEKERDDARKALGERTTEFAQFRKLSDDQVGKLSDAERVIYENQLTIAAKDAEIAKNATAAHENARDAVIRSKVGSNQALFDKVKDMYTLINLDDGSPEQISVRVSAALGALGQTAPDLLAAAGLGTGGSFEPPKKTEDQQKSFADTEQGKGLAAELGLLVEVPKK